MIQHRSVNLFTVQTLDYVVRRRTARAYLVSALTVLIAGEVRRQKSGLYCDIAGVCASSGLGDDFSQTFSPTQAT